jgi:probable addiction module antidote protein
METSKFDIADYLDSNEMIAEYLNAVLAEGNDSDVITAIGHIAKSIGMTKIAQETGLSRPSLYKALSNGAKPQFETIMKVLRAIGGQIQINPNKIGYLVFVFGHSHFSGNHPIPAIISALSTCFN